MSASLAPVSLTPQGPALSPIVAGVWRMADWNFDVAGRVRWIEQCLDLGITSFDHADIYGGYTVQSLFGAALAAAPGLRARVQLVSKCGIRLVSPQRPNNRFHDYDTSRAHVLASVDDSLRALRTDHIELLLIHRPDALMDPDALAEVFVELKAAGKIGHAGVSNHPPGKLAMLHRRHRLVTNQIEFSPLQLQALDDGTLDQCLDLGLRPMIWSPLGGGRLFTGQDERVVRIRDVLGQLAVQHAVSVATIAYAWILRHPSQPVPITGSHRIEALREATAALGVALGAEDWYRVWTASAGNEVP
jgi:predicted oxidoreductase